MPTVDYRDIVTAPGGPFEIRTEQTNSITLCASGNEEMLKITQTGFYVRGKKVKQDDKEAEVVYNAFRAWLTWAQLNGQHI